MIAMFKPKDFLVCRKIGAHACAWGVLMIYRNNDVVHCDPVNGCILTVDVCTLFIRCIKIVMLLGRKKSLFFLATRGIP